MVSFPTVFIVAAACGCADAFSLSGRFPPNLNSRSTHQVVQLHATSSSSSSSSIQDRFAAATTTLLSFALLTTPLITTPQSAFAAEDLGATSTANSKIQTGGASTIQSGRTISITRGVNLDRSDFKGMNLKGVAFQQSIVRDSDFRECNLVGASFFDATIDGSDFTSADMSMANLEMAQLNRANLKNAILRDMYVNGSTLLTGVKDIEGSDWSDTPLRKDQQKYLCAHPTAKGTNPVTGVDTRESLMCLD